MRQVTHSEIVRHGLLYIVNEFYKYGTSSLTGMFEEFETTHELLERYEEAVERFPRFKSECLFRYKQNKEIIISNRRYLTGTILAGKIKNAFHGIEQNHKYDLTTVIDEIYMSIDFILNELVDHINKCCKTYRVRRRITGYVELENISFTDSDATFMCDINTLEGFQGHIWGKSIMREQYPRLVDNENWVFTKMKNADGVFYIL